MTKPRRPEHLVGLSSTERRRMAIDQLVEVADAITSELVVGVRAEKPGQYSVGATRMLCWRDGVRDALRLLERRRRREDE